MLIGREFHSIIENIFIDVIGVYDNEQLKVNCPKCQNRYSLTYPDGKFNLEINTRKRVFKCWKCSEERNGGFYGNLKYLIKKYGSYNDYLIYNSYAKIFQANDYYVDNLDEEEIEVHLPEEYISFKDMDINNNEHIKAYNYCIIDRKLSRDTILNDNIGFCLKGRYWGRIIFPSYDQYNELNYFTSRTFKGQKPTYLNPQANKNKIIFNENKINFNHTIYLVEGIFDYYALPINTTMLLGKDIGEYLFSRLKKHKPNIVMLLDPDAYYNTIRVINKLKIIYSGCEDKLKFVPLRGKNDIDNLKNKYGKKHLIKLLKNKRELDIEDIFSGIKYMNFNEQGEYISSGSTTIYK